MKFNFRYFAAGAAGVALAFIFRHIFNMETRDALLAFTIILCVYYLIGRADDV